MTWQWQLQGAIDLTVTAQLFVVDLFEVTEQVIAALKTDRKIVICHFSAGTSESWRTDVSALPAAVLGNAATNRANETWLDVRAASVRQLMTARLALAATRGCNGVLPDAVDGYASNTGFPVGTTESLDYLTFLSNEATSRGLAVGLSNAPELAASVVGSFDFVVQVDCLNYGECASYRPFLDANKPVLHVEYVNSQAEGEQQRSGICGDAQRDGFSTILKLTGLDAWLLACE